MDKVTKIFLIVITVILAILLLVVLVATNKKEDDKSDYDISTMNEITEAEALALFESGKTYVLMFGYEDCEVCKDVVPMMARAQVKLNFITQYLDIFSIDMESAQWEQLAGKLSMKSTQAISEDGSGEKITETYGYFLTNYMMVPSVVIIKEGKQTGGFIGGVDEAELLTWLEAKLA